MRISGSSQIYLCSPSSQEFQRASLAFSWQILYDIMSWSNPPSPPPPKGQAKPWEGTTKPDPFQVDQANGDHKYIKSTGKWNWETFLNNYYILILKNDCMCLCIACMNVCVCVFQNEWTHFKLTIVPNIIKNNKKFKKSKKVTWTWSCWFEQGDVLH